MSSSEPGFKLTTTQWLVCVIAAIGFAFDIYELLMLPLIIKPAMAALSAPLIEQMITNGMDPAAARVSRRRRKGAARATPRPPRLLQPIWEYHAPR